MPRPDGTGDTPARWRLHAAAFHSRSWRIQYTLHYAQNHDTLTYDDNHPIVHTVDISRYAVVVVALEPIDKSRQRSAQPSRRATTDGVLALGEAGHCPRWRSASRRRPPADGAAAVAAGDGGVAVVGTGAERACAWEGAPMLGVERVHHRHARGDDPEKAPMGTSSRASAKILWEMRTRTARACCIESRYLRARRQSRWGAATAARGSMRRRGRRATS